VKDTKYQNVCEQLVFARLADSDSERLPVLNVFFVLELTKRLPANSPVIVTAVNPGYCRSQLKRNLPSNERIIFGAMDVLLAHTTEEGSRQLVWAAVGGAGRESELRGGFVSNSDLREVSDYVLSDEGAAVQTRLWVHNTFGHNWTRC
jgi:retinol dehydrogenase-12